MSKRAKASHAHSAEHRSPGRFRSWVARNTKILTFVGALIVFATFISKEAIGERQKESVDSLESAEEFYNVRTVLEGISNRLPNQNPPNVRDEIDKTRIVLYSVERLYAEMDANKDYANRLESIRTSLDDENKKFLIIVNSIFGSPRATTTLSIDPISQEKAAEKPILGEVQTQAGELGRLRYELISRADYESYRGARRYQIFTYISYFLYSIGWGLGLVARLFGIEDVASDD